MILNLVADTGRTICTIFTISMRQVHLLLSISLVFKKHNKSYYSYMLLSS